MNIKVLKCCLLVCVAVSVGGCLILESSGNERSDSAYQLPIALEGSLQNPAWSPDGRAILFTRFRNGYNEGPADLIVYDIESGVIRTLVSDGSDNVNLPGSTWNRDTDQIVLSSSREPHDEIYLINADENPGEEVKITDRVHQVAYEPSFSPDGQWIVFETHEVDVEGNGIITKYKIDKTEPYQKLTDANDDCRQPNWSTDGQHILYQKLKDDQWDIWIMDYDGTTRHQITSGSGDKADASFSPDGQWIVYSADEPTMVQANLFIIPITGGEPKRVTGFSGYDGAPSWSPNGEQVVFESSSGDPEETRGTTLWIIDAEK